jgi:hypothetical protein
MIWKTSNELKKELDIYVSHNADDLIKKLNKRKNSWKIKNDNNILCTK